MSSLFVWSTAPAAAGLSACLTLCLPVAAQASSQAAPGAGRTHAAAATEPTAVTRSAGLRPAPAGDGFEGEGHGYRATFTAAGTRFEPALGAAVAVTQHLALVPIAVRRGGEAVCALPSAAPPRREGAAIVFPHAPNAVERYEVRPEGLALSWVFPTPMPGSGDLVVRYAVDASLPAPRPAGAADGRAGTGGLDWVIPGLGGVHVGGVTGIDADGRTVAGSLRLAGGALELVLPAEFVASAHYPLVLDPTIGPVIGVDVGANVDAEPDAVWNAATGTWLVVWLRTFSSTDADIRGHLLDAGGNLVGGLIFFSSNGVATRPRTAALPVDARFLVVWQQHVGAIDSIEFQAVNAASGAITHTQTVFSENPFLPSLGRPDIGCRVGAASGLGSTIMVVYEHQLAIVLRRLFLAPGLVAVGNAETVFPANSPAGWGYFRPALARTARSDGTMLVVAQYGFFGTYDTVAGRVLQTDTLAMGPVTVLAQGPGSVLTPDVDGCGGRWVVAWSSHDLGGAVPDSVSHRRVDAGPGLALTLGPVSTQGGTLSSQASAASVGYAAGKTWIGSRNLAPLLMSTTLRVRGVDSGSGTPGTDVFSDTITGGEERIVVATAASGGDTQSDDSLCVWAKNDDVYAQRLVNRGTGGTVASLGGACGGGTAQSYSHNPAIGSAGLVCRMLPPPGTLLTIFNFNVATPAIPCGPCFLLPFSVTLTPPLVPGGPSEVEFPIPYLTSLVGQQFDTQWVSLVLAAAPCAPLAGLVMSDIARITIGP